MHGLELANSAGGGLQCIRAGRHRLYAIILLRKFTDLLEQVGALERLIDFQASLQSLGGVLSKLSRRCSSSYRRP